MKYGFTDNEIKTLKSLLRNFNEIDSALIFGSRALETYEKGSDVDIALKGNITSSTISSLKSEIDDTTLPYFFDILDYENIKEPKLKEQIDRHGKVFYVRGWEEMTLGDVTRIFSGSTPSTKEGSYWDGTIPWITPKDLSGYLSVYISRGERNITNEGLRNSSAQILPKNTILFSSRAPIGYVVIAKNEVTTNQGFKNVVCDEKNSHFKFFYYWLRNNSTRVEKLASGSIFSEATAYIMRGVPVDLPSFPEQHAIAAVLSSFDDKIELLSEQNKTLEATAQAIYKEWFVKFNYPGASGKIIDSELGEIPEEWRIGKIKDFGEIICGKTPPKNNQIYFGGDIPFIKIPDMHEQVFIQETVDSLTEEGARTQQGKFIPAKSICISCIATVGLVSITSQKSQTNQQINSIVLLSDSCLEYLFLALRNMEKDFLAIGTGGSATLNINTATFSNIKVIVPESDILKQFHASVSVLFQKLNFNNSQIQTLARLRDTLLPKLMKGEIRVKRFNR